MTDERLCANCGAQRAGFGRFCGSCGQEFEHGPDAPDEATSMSADATEALEEVDDPPPPLPDDDRPEQSSRPRLAKVRRWSLTAAVGLLATAGVFGGGMATGWHLADRAGSAARQDRRRGSEVNTDTSPMKCWRP